MILLLLGTKDRRSVEGRGKFLCPTCKVEREYEVVSLKEWFTFFFIPIFPTANDVGRDFFVECGICSSTYDPGVLESITGTQ